jgi:hypothetical protein
MTFTCFELKATMTVQSTEEMFGHVGSVLLLAGGPDLAGYRVKSIDKEEEFFFIFNMVRKEPDGTESKRAIPLTIQPGWHRFTDPPKRKGEKKASGVVVN